MGSESASSERRVVPGYPSLIARAVRKLQRLINGKKLRQRTETVPRSQAESCARESLDVQRLGRYKRSVSRRNSPVETREMSEPREFRHRVLPCETAMRTYPESDGCER